MFTCFTQVHSNACNFLIDIPIYKYFTASIMRSFGIKYAKFGEVTHNHYKITTFKKLAKLQANMEGFYRAGHKL